MKKIYIDELETKKQEIVDYSEKNIKNTVSELKVLPKNFVWQGKAYKSYIAGYEAKMSKLEAYNTGLTKIASFLSMVTENFNNANEKIENAYDELLKEFKKTEE